MNYEIHIKDMESLSDPLVLHYAQRDSISLKWLGGDDKTQPIVGSELNFTLETGNGEDGKYDQYFTSNEQKWQVTKVISETQEIVWRGFLLPESYSEPWENPLFYVGFSAVDGLGLLRGKKLSDEYYRDEKTVMDVICACLKLTGIDFDIYLSPAIRNHLKKKWHNVLMDTKKYYAEDELPFAHKLLEDIIFSMRCQLFQADGRWYIEGINKRQLIKLTYDTYDIDGNFLGEVQHEKNVKQLTYLPTPTITMIPPFKEVIVKHEASKLEFPKSLAQNQDLRFDGNQYSEVYSFYYSRYWQYNNYKPEVLVENDYLLLKNYANNTEFNENRKIELRNKLYILKNQRVKLKLKFKLETTETTPSESVLQSWTDIPVYRISLNGEKLFFNLNSAEFANERLTFDGSAIAEVELTFLAKNNGLLNVELFEPTNKGENGTVSGYFLQTLEIENTNQKEEFIYTVVLDENATSVKEIDLPISDDVSALSNCFYLQKLRALAPGNYTTITVSVIDSFVQDGKNNFSISLMGAYLIEQFANEIQEEFNADYFEIFYNFLGSELMILQADLPLSTQTIDVKVKKILPTTISRDEWLKWTDDLYEIEQKPYAQVVAEIDQKLFKKEHYGIECTSDKPVKFNDVIRFRYQNKESYFFPTNCEWRPDDNTSSLTLSQGVYNGSQFNDLPPFVFSGVDKYFPNPGYGITTGDAQALSPFGQIDSYLWEEIEGDGTSIISNPSNLVTGISVQSGTNFVFRLTVTDENGNTASDTFRFRLEQQTKISLDLLDEFRGGIKGFGNNTTHNMWWKKCKLTVSPELISDYSVNLKCKIKIEFNYVGYKNCYVTIKKNGIYTNYKITDGIETKTSTSSAEKEEDLIINYKRGDQIEVLVFWEDKSIVGTPDYGAMWENSVFVINEYETASGFVDVSGLAEGIEVFNNVDNQTPNSGNVIYPTI